MAQSNGLRDLATAGGVVLTILTVWSFLEQGKQKVQAQKATKKLQSTLEGISRKLDR